MRKIVTLSLSLLLAACAGTMESRLDTVRTGYADGKYMDAAGAFSGGTRTDAQDNLELLISADAMFHENEFAAADAAYEVFNHRNINLTDGDIGREIGAFLGGNMANDYRPYMMDALFVSYYQLWNALAMGNMADARVIINQSYDRQQAMSREYDALVKQIQDDAQKQSAAMAQLNTENSQWTAFRDIMNPALMYLSGVYFLNTGDFNNAKTYLVRTDGMTGSGNQYVRSDLAAARTHGTPKNTVWVFIHDGFAPKLYEERMDMPVLSDNGMVMASLALSAPAFWDSKTPIDGAMCIADVDAMFMTEYTQYRVNEVLRAIASSTAKTALQSSLYNSDSDSAPLLGMLATMYAMSTTNAEVRTWATLPQTISVWRTARPKNGLLEIKSGGNVIANADMREPGNYLVYVRMAGGRPLVKVIKI